MCEGNAPQKDPTKKVTKYVTKVKSILKSCFVRELCID